MNSDIEALAAISAGFKRNAALFEELRIKEIRASDTETAIRAFDLAFKAAMLRPFVRKTYPLSKAQRVLFGIEK